MLRKNFARNILIKKYVTALDNTNMDTVGKILAIACKDRELLEKIIEINLHYLKKQEDHIKYRELIHEVSEIFSKYYKRKK